MDRCTAGIDMINLSEFCLEFATDLPAEERKVIETWSILVRCDSNNPLMNGKYNEAHPQPSHTQNY